MKTVCLVLFLGALTGAATGLFRRKYFHVPQYKTWDDAQSYCRRNYVDLSTINSQGEWYRFSTSLSQFHYSYCWIGLRKEKYTRFYGQWSDGNVFTNWISLDNSYVYDDVCLYSYGGYWYDTYCTSKYRFSCYTWEPQLVVIQEMKTWDEALEHCRTFYTDLISLTTDTDLLMVNNQTRDAQTQSFWTGLRFLDGSWFWVEGEQMENLSTLPTCPARPFLCGAKTGPDVFENRDCEQKMSFMCYSEG